MVELVVVIIVLGILAATALPKLNGNDVYEELAAHDKLLAQLRHLQKFAAGSRRSVCLDTSSGKVTVDSSYTPKPIEEECSKPLNITLSGDAESSSDVVSFKNVVAVSFINNENETVAAELPVSLHFHSDGSISTENDNVRAVEFTVKSDKGNTNGRKIKIFGASGYIKGDA